MLAHLRALAAAMHGPPLRIYGVCLFALVMSNADQSLFSYAIPGIMAEFAVDLGHIGWILSVSFLAAALSTFLLGVLADQYGRRRLFAFCLVGPAALVGLQAFSPNVEVLTALRAAAFGVSSALPVIATTYAIEVVPDRYRGVLAGLLQLGYPMGWFLASLFSAPILAMFGWRALLLPAFLVIPVGLLLLRGLPESNRFLAAASAPGAGSSAPWTRARHHLRDRVLRRRITLCFIALFLFGGAYGGTAFYFPTFLTEARGFSPAKAVTVVGTAYGLGLAGYLTAAYVGEFVTSRRNTVAIWLFAGTAAMLGLFWASPDDVTDFLWLCLTTTFFYGASVAIWPLTAELFPTAVRASASALSTAGLLAGMGIYPLVVSRLVESQGWPMAFSLIVVPSLALSALAFLLLDDTRPGQTLDAVSLEGTGSH